MLGRTSGTDHVRAEMLGELHGQMADPAGRGVDQHALARLHVRGVVQDLPRGERRQWQRRGVHVVEAGRLTGEVS
ncbi:hypothetical protein [Nonomuraea solani]